MVAGENRGLVSEVMAPEQSVFISAAHCCHGREQIRMETASQITTIEKAGDITSNVARDFNAVASERVGLSQDDSSGAIEMLDDLQLSPLALLSIGQTE